MTLIASAKSGLTIRLSEERWQHITEEHPELANLQPNILQTIENPDKILEGNEGELLAAIVIVIVIIPRLRWCVTAQIIKLLAMLLSNSEVSLDLVGAIAVAHGKAKRPG